jgi:hypothetical protein
MNLINVATSCSEKVLEGKLLGNLSVLGKQRAQKLKTDTVVFDPTEFAEKIVRHYFSSKIMMLY